MIFDMFGRLDLPIAPDPVWRIPVEMARRSGQPVGWECPRCGACYSPAVLACQHCGPQTEAAAD